MANGTWYNKGFGAKAEDANLQPGGGPSQFSKNQTAPNFMTENVKRDFNVDPNYHQE